MFAHRHTSHGLPSGRLQDQSILIPTPLIRFIQDFSSSFGSLSLPLAYQEMLFSGPTRLDAPRSPFAGPRNSFWLSHSGYL